MISSVEYSTAIALLEGDGRVESREVETESPNYFEGFRHDVYRSMHRYKCDVTIVGRMSEFSSYDELRDRLLVIAAKLGYGSPEEQFENTITRLGELVLKSRAATGKTG